MPCKWTHKSKPLKDHHFPRPFCSTHQILLLRFKKKAVHCSLSCLITINMDNKACLKLLVLFLGLSFVLSSTAVPATRMAKSDNDPVQVQELLAQEAMEVSDSEEVLGMEQGYIEGRMDMESTDYPGTGANNHHDPKTPGRA
ncbi:hypothetical protein CICLE_v10022756mg [Citrus x clementina]|uniref:Uncharacterized protein n=2 Tax=Citrus TaxID=2706 RepID=V4VU77_CITCL|nr:hypothetical protein CICLE_v10022756mg [Citrus x clementina]